MVKQAWTINELVRYWLTAEEGAPAPCVLPEKYKIPNYQPIFSRPYPPEACKE